MTDQADSPTGSGVPSAGAQEPQVPKHRLDEQSALIRQLKETVEMQGQLLQQFAPKPQAPQAPQIDFQALGLDEQQGKAFMTLANAVADQKLAAERQRLSPMIGQLANSQEETDLLVKMGNGDPKKTRELVAQIPDLRKYQQEHARKTGGAYLPLETAFKLWSFDQAPQRQAAPAAPATPTPAVAAASEPAYPGAALTQVQPGGQGGLAPQKSGTEESLEDLAARINASIQHGSQL
jgi:hypothetical protein